MEKIEKMTPASPFTKLAASCSFLLVVLAGYAFRGAEFDLFEAWQTEEYSHGFFIPLIALFLGGHLLADRKPEIRPSWSGILFLLVACFLLFVTRLSAFEMTAEYGIVSAITGISLSILGTQATRVIAPALFYLIFAIPLPHLIQANLSQGLQLLSSTLGVWPLDAVGIPVLQEGNVIDLGGFRLQVVDACSGLRYLFPLTSFGYLVAVLLNDRMWKRILIVLSTIPISIALNAFRITIIGITVDLWGQKMAEGFIHAFEGWVIFLICLGLLLAETSLLLRVGKPRGTFRYDYLSLPTGRLFSHVTEKRGPLVAAFGILLVLAVTSATGFESSRERVPDHAPFATFPTQLSDWQGRQDRLSPEILSALQLNDYWLADYRRPADPGPVNFYIAYYDSQSVGTTTHSPSNCIPGGGWQITESTIVPVKLLDGTSLQVTRLVIKKDHFAQLVYYWFDERGRDLTETTYAKWYLLWDSITLHRTDGALVRLITPIENTDQPEKADEKLTAFLGAAYPSIKAFIPGAKPAKYKDIH